MAERMEDINQRSTRKESRKRLIEIIKKSELDPEQQANMIEEVLALANQPGCENNAAGCGGKGGMGSNCLQ